MPENHPPKATSFRKPALIGTSDATLRAIQGNDSMGTIQINGWRPRLRFSLRALMLVMTVVCIFLGYHVQRARDQRNVVATLEAAGARVSYDWQSPASNLHAPPGPAWLRAWVGNEYFQEIDGVYAWDVDNEHFERVFDALSRCRKLKHLHISSTQVIDLRNFESLRGLQQLETVVLSRGQFTDGVLQILGQLPKLMELNLSDEPVTNEGIQHLRTLRDLTTLNLSGTHINDDALVHVGQLHRLERLNLDDTHISDAGLHHLQQLNELTEFSAVCHDGRPGCKNHATVSLGDESLRLLAGHTKLTKLYVGQFCDQLPPQITGAGARSLVNLPLKELTLFNADLNGEDLRELSRITTLQRFWFQSRKPISWQTIFNNLGHIEFGISCWGGYGRIDIEFEHEY